jgi:hypothetical protein
MREAAAAFAEHAEAVRIVDQQPCIVAYRQLEQCRQRCDVAIHAEHAIDHDHAHARIAGGELALERPEVTMRKAMELRA